MGVSFSVGNKTYKFFNDSIVEKTYQSYKEKGIPILKCKLKNGDNAFSALMTEGKFDDNNKFISSKNLLNGDVVGAQDGDNAKPLFIAKSKSGSLYSFIRLNQRITFTYKYQNIESWVSYEKSKKQTLTIVSWESLFPLENEYACSLGFVSFKLPAGKTSGTIDKSYTYYNEEPKSGVKCFLSYGDLTQKTYNGVDYYSIQNIKEVYGKTAVADDKTHSWQHTLFLFVWEWRVRADWLLTWLDASDSTNITWKSRLVEGVTQSQSASEWWAGKKPQPGSFKTTSFTTILGSVAFDENNVKFNETYVVEAKKNYGAVGAGPGTDWYAYTQSTVSGSSEGTDKITFSFAYNGD